MKVGVPGFEIPKVEPNREWLQYQVLIDGKTTTEVMYVDTDAFAGHYAMVVQLIPKDRIELRRVGSQLEPAS